MSEFGQINIQDIQSESSRLSSKPEANNNASFLEQFVQYPKVKAGTASSLAIRILPPLPGEPLYQYNRTHKVNGRSIHCPRPLVDGKWDWKVPCALCEYVRTVWARINELKKHPDQKMVEDEIKSLLAEAGRLKANERYYYNVIVRGVDTLGKPINIGPKIWAVGKTLHQLVIGAFEGIPGVQDSKLGNVTDLAAGYDFIIKLSVTAGAEQYPKFDGSSFARHQSAAGTKDEISYWAKNVHDLKRLRNPKDAEQIEKELAIYKGYLAESSLTVGALDMDEFKNKWQASSSTQVAVVDILPSHSSEHSSSVPSAATTQATQTTQANLSHAAPQPSSTSTGQSLPIMDEDFMNALEGLNMDD